MILSYFLALLLGIIVGSVTGLIPGIHINLVGGLMISSSLFLIDKFGVFESVIFLVSLSIAHTFLDMIPGIFLGSPNDDSSLSSLPGHALLKKGRGFEASIYSIYGGLIGVFSFVILIPLTLWFIPRVYPYLQSIIFYILIFTSIYLIFSQKNKFLAFFVFVLSGFLGLSSLNIGLSQPLLPLLSGLFGSSSLISSIIDKTSIPKQEITRLRDIKFRLKDFWSTSKALLISSPIVSFLPGLGSSQAAVIGSNLIDSNNRKSFILLIGGVNTLVLSLSFVGLYTINKARTGAAAVIPYFLDKILISDIFLILIVILVSSFIASIIAFYSSRVFSLHINRVNYRIVSVITLTIVTSLVFWFSGFLGLLVFLTSSALGLFAIYSGIRRTNLMGCLIIPTIIIYWPF